ncbi:hypothetical protein [Mesonia sp.]|uniref:hypothetical protein n=1 Tax=Mesonia sp. TaxID=1960830 RepID=UPI00175B1CF8|nr:hypothetical protein [Mesonia sp.]HIB38088.1 hypothetical protein [Mesonia sp.]
MKLKLLVFFIFSLLSINTFSQNINSNPFWKGEITLTDGTIKKGLVQVPNNPAQSKVTIKSSDGKKNRIKKKDIKLVKVFSESGKIYEFEPIKVVLTIKGNASLGKYLLLISNKNDYAKIYLSYGAYRINKNGELYMLYRYMVGRDFPTLEYYIKKRNAEKGRLLHATNLTRGFKKSANAYFKEAPALLQKINNNELKFKDIDKIAKIYIDTTKEL